MFSMQNGMAVMQTLKGKRLLLFTRGAESSNREWQ